MILEFPIPIYTNSLTSTNLSTKTRHSLNYDCIDLRQYGKGYLSNQCGCLVDLHPSMPTTKKFVAQTTPTSDPLTHASISHQQISIPPYYILFTSWSTKILRCDRPTSRLPQIQPCIQKYIKGKHCIYQTLITHHHPLSHMLYFLQISLDCSSSLEKTHW